MATVAAEGTPRLRTLMFRGWAGRTSLDLLTNGRSVRPAALAPLTSDGMTIGARIGSDPPPPQRSTFVSTSRTGNSRGACRSSSQATAKATAGIQL